MAVVCIRLVAEHDTLSNSTRVGVKVYSPAGYESDEIQDVTHYVMTHEFMWDDEQAQNVTEVIGSALFHFFKNAGMSVG